MDDHDLHRFPSPSTTVTLSRDYATHSPLPHNYANTTKQRNHSPYHAVPPPSLSRPALTRTHTLSSSATPLPTASHRSKARSTAGISKRRGGDVIIGDREEHHTHMWGKVGAALTMLWSVGGSLRVVYANPNNEELRRRDRNRTLVRIGIFSLACASFAVFDSYGDACAALCGAWACVGRASCLLRQRRRGRCGVE